MQCIQESICASDYQFWYNVLSSSFVMHARPPVVKNWAKFTSSNCEYVWHCLLMSLADMECCLTAILQSSWRPQIWTYWRRSAGPAKQPDALCSAGGGRPSTTSECLWQWLWYRWWHGSQGLHSCRWSCTWPCCGTEGTWGKLPL